MIELTFDQKKAYETLDPIQKRYVDIVRRKTFESDELKKRLLEASPKSYDIKEAKPIYTKKPQPIIDTDIIDVVFNTIYPPVEEKEIEYIKQCIHRGIYKTWGDILTNLKKK